MKALVLILSLMGFSAHAQTQDREEINRQIEEIMKAREELFRSLLDDTGMDMQKHMEEMMKRFGGEDAFDLSSFGVRSSFSYAWEETPTHRLLKMNLVQSKDNPVDIKIEKGMIRIKGEIINKINQNGAVRESKSQFDNSLSLPRDVDQANPEFDQDDKSITIKFKKLKASATQKNSKEVIKNQTKPDRVPVQKSGDDLSL